MTAIMLCGELEVIKHLTLKAAEVLLSAQTLPLGEQAEDFV